MNFLRKTLRYGLFWSFENGLVDSEFRGSYEECDAWALSAKDSWSKQGSASPTLQGRIERQTKDVTLVIVPIYC